MNKLFIAVVFLFSAIPVFSDNLFYTIEDFTNEREENMVFFDDKLNNKEIEIEGIVYRIYQSQKLKDKYVMEMTFDKYNEKGLHENTYEIVFYFDKKEDVFTAKKNEPLKIKGIYKGNLKQSLTPYLTDCKIVK